MWLTSREICTELKITPGVLYKWRVKRKIRFVQIGSVFRYELPQATEPTGRPIERIALLSYAEAAEILGLSRIRIRVGVHKGEYHSVSIGKRSYFTVKEMRRILADREKRSGQAKQKVSKILVAWARHYLEKDDTPVQILEELLNTAAAHLPEPQRSQTMSRLWQLFDQVDDVMRSIKPK